MSCDANFAVVRELYPEKRGLFRNKTCPAVNETLESVYGMDKAYVVSSLSTPGARDAAAKRGDRLFAVSKRRIGFSTVALKVCKEDGYEWNYAIEGAIKISDPAKFLLAWARDEGACGLDGIDSVLFAHGVLAALEPKIRDVIAECRREHGYRISDIEEKDALPTAFWTKAFSEVGDQKLAGLSVDVTDKSFLSPNRDMEAKRIAAAEKQRELEEQVRREYQAAVNGKMAEAELEELDRQRKRVQLAFEKEQAELEAAIKKQRIDLAIYEANQLNEAKVKLQKALNDEEIRRQQAMGQTESEQVKSMSAAMAELVGKIGTMMDKLGALGVEADAVREKASATKADPVVAPRYHGMSDNFNSVMQGLRDAADDGILISLEAARCHDGFATRDLLPVRPNNGVKVPEGILHVGDQMTLRLKSPRSGYLTLFNFGTSGHVSKIFPHQNFGTTRNRIDAGRVYMLPGELLPADKLYNGVWEETGPLSKLNGLPERVIAVLTDDPVDLDEQVFGEQVSRVLTRGGFDAVEESISSLLDLPRGSWIWGGLEAVVEG